MFRYVCIGGGGNKSLIYVGALQAMEDAFHQIYAKSWEEHVRTHMLGFGGASGGAVLALCMCLNLRTADVRAIIEPYQTHMHSIIPNPDISNLIQHFGIEQGCAMREVVERLIRAGGIAEDTTFARMFSLTGRQFVCSGTNLNTRRARIFSHRHTPDMRVADAVFISMCIPLVFSPVKYDGDLYADGALTCNYPCDCFVAEETLLLGVESSTRVPIDGWSAYINQIISIGIVSQDDSIKKRAGRTITLRLSSRHRQDASFEMGGTMQTDELIALGYAGMLDALLDGMLWRMVIHIMGTIVHYLQLPSSCDEDESACRFDPGSQS